MKCNTCGDIKKKYFKCDKCKVSSNFCNKCLDYHKKSIHIGIDNELSKFQEGRKVRTNTSKELKLEKINKSVKKETNKHIRNESNNEGKQLTNYFFN